MRSFISYSTPRPDTILGYKVAITYTYSSFDKEEIEELEKYLKDKIGDGLLIESPEESEVEK